MDDNEPNDDFSEYIDYRNIEDIEESLSGSSKFASSTTTSKRSSFNSQQQQVKKLKLSKSEKSFVWKYFERIDDGKVRCIMSITKNGKEEPCNATYKYLSFTLNMKYHLNSLHNITEGEEQEEPKVQQAKIDSIFGKAKSHGKSHQHKLNILLLEFIITDSQPFHILKSNRFRKLLLGLDPSYSIPYDKMIKTLITDVYKLGIKELLSLIISTCEFISITTDLWMARSKAGYIGITGHWVDENFKPYDMLITIESIQYPHTAVVISKYLEKYIEEYRLENKIICVVTDNGSNMKAAVNILNQKNDKIQRLPCVAHTLQLTVINTLKSISKQPIIRLNATLHLEDDRSNKIDGERLQKIMLCEEEWIFLKELCKLFKPFDEMTTYFSGVEYVTISSILPIVETLKLIYKTKLKENYDTEIEDLNDINLDNITIIDDSENMKENLSDESEEENKISDNSESDETSNEPIIIRPHKHNLHKKVKKINYSDSSRKSQNISENILQKSQPESANSDQIIKRVLVTIKVACQN
ncbi:unnamed protein product [Rhizophagus irregularis]|uniref:DUF659 domain-containing protein n=1 Tax=Rhizophagus irregularis TaxID=588596 RepID=A0A915YMT1_9GLOM|nr:unnamed protein product [Rhizophagus irregularis]